MNKLLNLLLLTGMLTGLFSFSSNSVNAQSSNCLQAIEGLKQESKRRNVFNPYNDSIVGRVMPEIGISDGLDQTYYDYPRGRTTEMAFILTGDYHILRNFLNSPRLMESISRPVLLNCDDVGLINYNRYTAFYFHGPDNNPVGYFLDGSVRKFTFFMEYGDSRYMKVDPNGNWRNSRFRWGYYNHP